MMVPLTRLLASVRARLFGRGALAAVFSDVHRHNRWLDAESRSGPGSSRQRTARVRAVLAEVLRDCGIRSLLDAPCGDFNWMSALDLTGLDYTGVDIVPQLIRANRREHAGRGRRFLVRDLTTQRLPRADLVLCRDCLVHLPFTDALQVVANIRRSGSTYLLATTFPACENNEDSAAGGWRALNLERLPFRFPAPVHSFPEGCPVPGYADKALGLWKVADLP